MSKKKMSEQRLMPLLSQRHRLTVILSLGVTALLYLAVVLFTGADEMFRVFSRLGIAGWFTLLGFSMASYLLRFLRWQYYLKLAGWRLPPSLHLAYYLAGFSLTTTPGKAGETIRSVLLRPHGVPYPTSLACFFAERLLDVVVVALFAALLVVGFHGDHGFILAVFAVAISVIPILHSQLLPTLLTRLRTRTRSSRLVPVLNASIQLLHGARDLLAPRPLYAGLLLGILAWSMQGLAFYFLMQGIGFELSLPLAVGIYSFGLLAGALSMIPGGIGTTEVATGLLLAAAGADPQIAVAAPLISRLSTLWFAVALGLLASAWLAGQRPTPEAA
jgi:uncharacterized protein (TIRG00374 family)